MSKQYLKQIRNILGFNALDLATIARLVRTMPDEVAHWIKDEADSTAT